MREFFTFPVQSRMAQIAKRSILKVFVESLWNVFSKSESLESVNCLTTEEID